MDNTIIFTGDVPASTLSSAVARGDVVRLARGVSTTDSTRAPDAVVRANWAKIVGRLLPDAVITDRSARSGAPVNGVLYLAHDARVRDLEMPGLRVRARRGAAPQRGDVPYPGGLYLASSERGLVENCLPSRARKGDRRTMDAAELGEWVDYLCGIYGGEHLVRLRRRAEEIAPTLGVTAERLATLPAAIGVELVSCVCSSL